jgi:hypothetical protein
LGWVGLRGPAGETVLCVCNNMLENVIKIYMSCWQIVLATSD